MSEATAVAGRSVPRLDARAKVTGKARYAADERTAGLAYGKVVRSTVGHGRIVRIDADAARGASGVVAVITAADLDVAFPRFGHIIADHPILAGDKVRHYGEPVALVVAETSFAASDAAELVTVSYENLPVVVDAADALAPDAPLLHERTYELGDASFAEAFPRERHGNVVHEAGIDRGDVEAVLASSAHVVTTTMRYPMLYAYAMEPYNALARFDEGVLDVVSTAQHPYQVRGELARIFAMPLAAVRVRSPFIGGGYGSKSYTKVEPLAAVGAWVSRRPVKVALDVEEAMFTTRADSAVVTVTSGFDADGTITGRDIDIVLNSGAYADNSPLVLAKAVVRSFGPYRVPNLRVRGVAVYTNTTPASSYRGFGAPQGALAGETNLDQAADALGISPIEIRRRNLLEPKEVVLEGKRPLDADLAADLDLLTAALDAARPRPGGRGVGFGCTASDAGAYPVSTVTLRLLPDGSVVLLTGATEMGQGSRTALAQIAATELGVALEAVRVVQGDTSSTSYERTTGASRTTVLAGMAVMRACRDARRKLESMAAEAFGVAESDVSSGPGAVSVNGDDYPFGEIVERWFGASAGEVTGIGIVRKSGDHEQLPPFWEIGMSGVEVAVDADTGAVTVEHLVTVGDVGYAVNPHLVEGQDLGAATQGLGAALWEEFTYDGAQPANANVVDYRVPRTTDMPAKIDTILAERGDGIGPYGAKGAGEGALNPIGAAVASAVARAIGTWPDELPLTAERIWKLMRREK